MSLEVVGSCSSFVNPITCSMWILTRASCWENSTSFWVSCDLPHVNAGIASLPPCTSMSSYISNPLSANTVSPGSEVVGIHSALWGVCLIHVHTKNEIQMRLFQLGIQQSKTWWCCVSFIVSMLVQRGWNARGRSVNTSEQSIIHRALGYVSLNIRGILACATSCVGHVIRNFNRVAMTSIQVLDIGDSRFCYSKSVSKIFNEEVQA